MAILEGVAMLVTPLSPFLLLKKYFFSSKNLKHGILEYNLLTYSKLISMNDYL